MNWFRSWFTKKGITIPVDLMQVIAENPVLKGSFIEDLFKAMKSGQKVDNFSLVKAGEEPIGELNALEWALHCVYNEYRQTEKAIIARFLGDAKSVSNRKEETELEAKLDSCRKRTEIIKPFLWDSIKNRLGKNVSMGIRRGGKIVLRKEGDKVDLFEAMFTLSLLEGLAGRPPRFPF